MVEKPAAAPAPAVVVSSEDNEESSEDVSRHGRVT